MDEKLLCVACSDSITDGTDWKQRAEAAEGAAHTAISHRERTEGELAQERAARAPLALLICRQDEMIVELEAQVAELEERLMVMCVGQINGAELEQIALADREMLLEIMKDLEFTVWNCEHCGHAEPTSTMDVAYTLRDYLKAAPPMPKQSRPSPDPPAPAPESAQGVEGEPEPK